MPNADLDIARTRARLAAVERQLLEDPDNEELRWDRFRLANVLRCHADYVWRHRCAAWGRLFLGAWSRRN
jgi:hypothetical protein